jgi:formylmethanofuran--tetrahydromethanopterin N-formyltransferase
MKLGPTEIVETFAEAFPMTAARVIISAETPRWARTAATVMTGYATSVILCDCEAGIERFLTPEETPDGRPGVSVLVFGFSRDGVAEALLKRVGQCVMTCPTTACFDGLPIGTPGTDPEKRVNVGGKLRFFGDGFQASKWIDNRRLWRIPVMDGEFLCDETFGTIKGVGGGNFLILGTDQSTTLTAAERAVDAMGSQDGVILPFPGGVVRSGSKVGSRYAGLRASTNEAYCPTLRGRVESSVPDSAHAVYEIVLDGTSEQTVASAMRIGIEAACGPGIVQISAGNYGGKLGPFHFWLPKVLAGVAEE